MAAILNNQHLIMKTILPTSFLAVAFLFASAVSA
jgi:hypothetical protein